MLANELPDQLLQSQQQEYERQGELPEPAFIGLVYAEQPDVTRTSSSRQLIESVRPLGSLGPILNVKEAVDVEEEENETISA